MQPTEPPLEETLYRDEPGAYAPYDPQVAAPTPDGDGHDDEPDSEPPPAGFDPRHSQEFAGLLYLGALTRTFDWLGHRFVIRTMRTDELIQAALVAKRYLGSDGYAKAYQSAVTAGCVVTVDGRPIPVVPVSDTDPMLEQRADWVMRHWFPPVLDRVYEEYVRLETVVREVMEDMGKASG